MTLAELIAAQKTTKYRVSRNSGIPYTTLSDICRGKTTLSKCSAETVYKLAKELNVSMDELLEPYMTERIGFELFKSNVCHRLNAVGDRDFLVQTLERDDIRKYYERGWYPESLYLLAMLDYISRLNNIPLCTRYDDLRCVKLKKTIYPAGILAIAAVTDGEQIKQTAVRESIPEFLRFNIVENEVRDVV